MGNPGGLTDSQSAATWVHPESQTVACERWERRVHLEGPRRVVLGASSATM